MIKKLVLLLLLSGLFFVSRPVFAETLTSDSHDTQTSEIQSAPEVNSKATIGFSTKDLKTDKTEKIVKKPVGRTSIETFPSMGELLTNNWVIAGGIILVGLFVIICLKRAINRRN